VQQVGHVPVEQRVGELPADGDAHLLAAQALRERVQVDEHGVEDVLPAGSDAPQVFAFVPTLPFDEGLPHCLVVGELRPTLAHDTEDSFRHTEALAVVE